jgi:hypothetical protein
MQRSFSRHTLPLITGAVMILLGAFIALRPLWAGPRPLSNSRWLDVAFAAFFLLRGLMNVRGARKVGRDASERRQS